MANYTSKTWKEPYQLTESQPILGKPDKYDYNLTERAKNATEVDKRYLEGP